MECLFVVAMARPDDVDRVDIPGDELRLPSQVPSCLCFDKLAKAMGTGIGEARDSREWEVPAWPAEPFAHELRPEPWPTLYRNCCSNSFVEADNLSAELLAPLLGSAFA